MSTNSNNSSIQVGKKTFITSVLILLALMTISGILTKVVPAGMYSREVIDGTVTIVPNSFTFIESSGLPIYKWYTAPIEVLFSSDSLMIITIILFILIIGATFNILDKSNILKYIMSSVASKFSDRKYVLLTVMSFMFMIFGSTIGIFEEMVPLVPIIIALSFVINGLWVYKLLSVLFAVGFSIFMVLGGFYLIIIPLPVVYLFQYGCTKPELPTLKKVLYVLAAIVCIALSLVFAFL